MAQHPPELCTWRRCNCGAPMAMRFHARSLIMRRRSHVRTRLAFLTEAQLPTDRRVRSGTKPALIFLLRGDGGCPRRRFGRHASPVGSSGAGAGAAAEAAHDAGGGKGERREHVVLDLPPALPQVAHGGEQADGE